MATLTGEDVTECVGGAAGPGLDGLHRRYASARDPRLDKDRRLHRPSWQPSCSAPNRHRL
ncbi:3-deoxy-7-phosphoheptulonate synthase [Streptomyces cacaoi]|uniref:3-deoxy-7-phosphoheptulonate synthase n=1 Tax=Streptomyces cacaoi TaxID=1898 RepID=UPI0033B62690